MSTKKLRSPAEVGGAPRSRGPLRTIILLPHTVVTAVGGLYLATSSVAVVVVASLLMVTLVAACLIVSRYY